MFGEHATVVEVAEKWGLKERICPNDVPEWQDQGAKKFGRDWAIPTEANRPANKRVVTGQYIGYRSKNKQD